MSKLYKITKIAEEIKFLREQINTTNSIIRSLLSLKLSKREEDNLSYRVKKILIAKICLKVVLIMKPSSVNV